MKKIKYFGCGLELRRLPMRYGKYILCCSFMLVVLSQQAWALETYNVGSQYLCKGILHSGKLYYSSSANSLVGEYDLVLGQVKRTWNTGDYYPTQIYLHQDGNRIFVALNRYPGIDAEGAIGVIDLISGNIAIHAFDDFPILNLVLDPSGDYLFASSGYQLNQAGTVLKIDCSTWLPMYQADAGDYPLGLCYMAVDSLPTSTSDFVPTYYEEENGTFPGPPYFSKLKIYTDDPRLALRTEAIIPEGLNYIKKMDNSRMISLHMPLSQGPCICVLDGYSGAVIEEIEVPGIAGVLDAAYSPVTYKIYATVVIDAGGYDPETEVPELAYCGHLLVYDTLSCDYNLYEDYFDSQVSMINLCEGQLVVNSIDAPKIYLETPF
jgi:hypothetical protein